MPQSYTCLNYHFIFSTKHRVPSIRSEWKQRLYDYLGGLIRSERGVLISAGGIADHVHLLARLGQNRAISDVLRVVKTNSSKWVHETFPGSDDFGWQNGFGAFSVSNSGIEGVKAYIAGQEDHHRTLRFQDEYREFLVRHEILFDEKYLWE